MFSTSSVDLDTTGYDQASLDEFDRETSTIEDPAASPAPGQPPAVSGTTSPQIVGWSEKQAGPMLACMMAIVAGIKGKQYWELSQEEKDAFGPLFADLLNYLLPPSAAGPVTAFAIPFSAAIMVRVMKDKAEAEKAKKTIGGRSLGGSMENTRTETYGASSS